MAVGLGQWARVSFLYTQRAVAERCQYATRLSAFLRVVCSVVCLGARILGQFELCSDTVSREGSVRPLATSCHEDWAWNDWWRTRCKVISDAEVYLFTVLISAEYFKGCVALLLAEIPTRYCFTASEKLSPSARPTFFFFRVPVFSGTCA